MMLGGHYLEVQTVASCEERVYSGSADCMIGVWNRATLEHERTLDATHTVNALVVWEGLLISGHGGGYMSVWSIATGERKWEFQGHDDDVWALITVGQLLVSASWDGSIKVWAMLAEGPWQCKKTLMDGKSPVSALATWKGKVMSGADDGFIRVWDAETGALETKFMGHKDWVRALLVHEGRLFSASADGTIRAWALGTWEAMATVQAYSSEEERYVCCLAVSGGRLVSGSRGGTDDDAWFEVYVWDLTTLECKRTLHQPAEVHCLVSVGWEVWCGVGQEVVVWGRDEL
jgi:WD40 repeat protein